MVDQRLVDYIKSELSRGNSLQQIKQNLLTRGWPNYDVNEAVSFATEQKTFPSSQTPIKTGKPTKKYSILLIILVLIVVIIIGGGFAFLMLTGKEAPVVTAPIPPTQELTETLEPIDCGTDMDCFIAASQTCKMAKVTYDSTIKIFGMLITTTSFYEIKGTDASSCLFYLRTEKQDIDFEEELVQQMLASGTTQEEIQQQKQEANKQTELIEGRDGTCKFNAIDLTAILSRWKEGIFEGGASCTLMDGEWKCTYTGDWEVAEDCQGTYFSQEM